MRSRHNSRAGTKEVSRSSVLSKINPVNKERECARFFANPFRYNPIFKYVEEVPADLFEKYKPSNKYLPEAVAILRRIQTEFGSLENFLVRNGGDVLGTKETEEFFKDYLNSYGLQNALRLNFTADLVPTTSLSKGRINIRLPIQYRRHTLQGTCDHEIGTHYLRSHNNKKQVWHQRRKAFRLSDHLETEEGLAVLNAHQFCRYPFLWKGALMYYTAYMASQMSFNELFHHLEMFVRDEKIRWDACVQCKRGLVFTACRQAFGKDQCYLSGAIQILEKRRSLDFRSLYCGKISLADLDRLEPFMNSDDLRLPLFLEDMDEYLNRLDIMAAVNGIA